MLSEEPSFTTMISVFFSFYEIAEFRARGSSSASLYTGMIMETYMSCPNATDAKASILVRYGTHTNIRLFVK